MFTYQLTKQNNIRVFYRTNTNAPAINQLQSVIDHYCLQLKVKPIVISAYLKEKGTALEIKELKM